MNPYQTPVGASCSSFSLSESGDLYRLRNFTGNYYRVLGWIGVASNAITLSIVYWTDYLYFDLSFLVWFWLGNRLKNGSPAARKWAIAVFLIVSAFFVLGFVFHGTKATFGGLEFDRSHPAFFVILGINCATFAVPGVILLGKRGRAAFAGNEEGEQAVDGNPH